MKFKCDSCQKAYTYQAIKGHRGRGECFRGPAQDEEME